MAMGGIHAGLLELCLAVEPAAMLLAHGIGKPVLPISLELCQAIDAVVRT